MTVALYTPYCTATINGVQIAPDIVTGARAETSLSDPVSKGYVKCIGAVSFGQGDAITIALGSGANNLTRFAGAIYAGEWSNSEPPTFDLTCYGPLFAAQKYRNNRPNGITLQELTGGPATDEAIARAVLDICGVSYSAGNIGGTGIVRGGSAAVAYTWKPGETGLDYLARLSKASLGYKVVEADREVFRTQVLGVPSGSLEFTLTEGLDIFAGGRVQKSSIETFTAWQVTGFDYGDGLGAVTFTYPDPIPDGIIPYAYPSDMIERNTDADPRSGISAQTVLGLIRSETNHTIVKVSGISTPRDDLFGPGQRHHISSSRLGINQDVMCMSVTTEADQDWFQQTMAYVG